MTQVRTRFAPSPTGYLHLGGARTALFSWAYARRHNGKFILRIEDTDEDREKTGAIRGILDAMEWLGLDYDEGPYFQTDRMKAYEAADGRLQMNGRAYLCYMKPEELDKLREEQLARGEKPKYDGRWRPENKARMGPTPLDVKPVIRFKNPLDGAVTWDDAVKGRISIQNQELDDLIIFRSNYTPTYNFCVAIDDLDMGITHVLRGDDHVNNTPRQINIIRALGKTPPVYAHLPMVLDETGKKLSKRTDAANVMWLRDQGYTPAMVINYLARLGWSHGDSEIFSREQFVEWFDLEHLGKSPARFNMAKLNSVRKAHLKEVKSYPAAAVA